MIDFQAQILDNRLSIVYVFLVIFSDNTGLTGEYSFLPLNAKMQKIVQNK